MQTRCIIQAAITNALNIDQPPEPDFSKLGSDLGEWNWTPPEIELLEERYQETSKQNRRELTEYLKLKAWLTSTRHPRFIGTARDDYNSRFDFHNRVIQQPQQQKQQRSASEAGQHAAAAAASASASASAGHQRASSMPSMQNYGQNLLPQLDTQQHHFAHNDDSQAQPHTMQAIEVSSIAREEEERARIE